MLFKITLLIQILCSSFAWGNDARELMKKFRKLIYNSDDLNFNKATFELKHSLFKEVRIDVSLNKGEKPDVKVRGNPELKKMVLKNLKILEFPKTFQSLDFSQSRVAHVGKVKKIVFVNPKTRHSFNELIVYINKDGLVSKTYSKSARGTQTIRYNYMRIKQKKNKWLLSGMKSKMIEGGEVLKTQLKLEHFSLNKGFFLKKITSKTQQSLTRTDEKFEKLPSRKLNSQVLVENLKIN